MKRPITALLFILIAGAAFAEDNAIPMTPTAKNGFTQLIGFKGGGELFIGNFMSDWSTGIFFESVLAPFLGMEIELTKASIPITNYYYAPLAITITGNGKKDYVEIGGGLKFYIQSVAISLGLTYNSFVSGYIVDSTTGIYQQIPGTEINFFSIYLGPELTAQVSTDLFTKVGLKFIFGFVPSVFASTFYNETMGIRFYLTFAYGI